MADGGSGDSRPVQASGISVAKRCRLDEELLMLFDEDRSCSTDSSTSSSSDSSGSGDDEDLALYEQMFEQLFTPPEKRHKIESYVEKTVAAYSDEEFRRNFRLSRLAADSLAAEFAKSPHYPSRTDRGGLPTKSPQEHVLSFLWFQGFQTPLAALTGAIFVLGALLDKRLSSQVNNDQSPTVDEVCSGISREESLLRALAEVKREKIQSKIGLKRRYPQSL
ncbi:hypothetical protein V5799_025014 [Amblyomma americanum]|uniref:Uncharacterized protein n=1 Tax=Amblyomma americanum TaxID=6943 RepID=A0AAQ4EAN9_AMBAM